MALGILLLIGGTETTTNLLGNTLALLHNRPDIYDAVKRDPALVPDLFEEVLRFDTPVQMVFRNTAGDTRWNQDPKRLFGVAAIGLGQSR
jgi:cytochrome P450 family 109